MGVIEGIEFTDSIPEDRYEDVIIHLRNNFFADEPLNSSVELCKPGEPHKDLEFHCYKTLQNNYSLMACEKDTGKIAGVILSGIIHKGDYELEIEKLNLVSDERFKQIFNFLFTTNQTVDLFKKYNTDEIFELRILSVDSSYRCRGIGIELISRAIELAQKNGFKLHQLLWSLATTERYKYWNDEDMPVLKGDATNIFSQKVLHRLGFETILEVFYKNHTSENGEILFNTTEPHNSLKIMVKCLED